MTTIAAPEWLTRALESLRSGRVDGFLQMYDDDAVHEFPCAPEGRPERLQGKAAIAEHLRNLPKVMQFDSFDDVRVREAGDELIVEANGHGKRIPSGVPFHTRYVWFITHEGGRVSRFKDYMHPLRVRSAGPPAEGA